MKNETKTGALDSAGAAAALTDIFKSGAAKRLKFTEIQSIWGAADPFDPRQ
jgi:hypothetical protein